MTVTVNKYCNSLSEMCAFTPFISKLNNCCCDQLYGYGPHNEVMNVTSNGYYPRLPYKLSDFKSYCIMRRNLGNVVKRVWQILTHWCLFVNSALSTIHEEVSFLVKSVSAFAALL